jgi:cobalt-zinc-cadmium efflux system outer membrane protein
LTILAKPLFVATCVCLLFLGFGVTPFAMAEEGDSTLSNFERLYQRALVQNHDLQILRKHLKVTEADIIIAGYIPNPSVNGYWGWGRQTSVLGNSNYVGITQELEIGPKRKLRKLIAKAELEEEKAAFQEAIWLLRSNLRLAYLQYLGVMSELKQLEEQIRLSESHIVKVKAILKEEMRDETDLLNAQLTLSKLHSAQIEHEGELRQKRLYLAELVGESSTDLLPLHEVKTGLFKDVPYWQYNLSKEDSNLLIQKLSEVGRHNRQELKIAIQTLEQGYLELKASKLKRIPNPELGAGFLFVTTTSPYTPNFEKETFLGGFATINVPVPLFNRQEGEIAKAQSEVITNKMRIHATQFNIGMGIQKAVEVISTKQKLLKNYEDYLFPQSRDIVRLVDLSYQKKQVDYSQVILASQAYQEISHEYLEHLEEAWQAWASLEQETGVPLEILIPTLPWKQPKDFVAL